MKKLLLFLAFIISGLYSQPAPTSNFVPYRLYFSEKTDAQITTLGTPASGYGFVYEKDDGFLYFKDDAGTEYLLSNMTSAGVFTVTADGDTFRVDMGTALYVLDIEIDDSRIFGVDSLGNIIVTGTSLLEGTVTLTTAGVTLDGADGVLTMAGVGDGNDLDILWDFDNHATATTIGISSGSATILDFGTIGITTTGGLITGNITITDGTPNLTFNDNTAPGVDDLVIAQIDFKAQDSGSNDATFGYLKIIQNEVNDGDESGWAQLNLLMNNADTEFFRMYGAKSASSTAFVEWNQGQIDMDFEWNWDSGTALILEGSTGLATFGNNIKGPDGFVIGTATTATVLTLASGGDVALEATKKWGLDGTGGHTYWAETASDVLSAFVGGVEGIRVSEANGELLHTFGGTEVENITGASTTNGAATLTKGGENFDVTCTVGDVVFVYGGTTAADYGTYIIKTIAATILTVDRNFSATNADVDFFVINNAIVLENSRNTSPKLLLPLDNDAAAPTLAFGDGDSGLYESAVNVIKVSLGGTNIFAFEATAFKMNASNRAAIMVNTPNATTPVFVPTFSDNDTGIGYAGEDSLSLIAGGVEGIRISESTTITGILYDVWDVTGALTMLTGQTDTDMTVGVLANDVMAVFSIVGDAENDNATPINETYSAVLVQNADPTLAFLQWSTTQSTVGMDFDMPVTASSFVSDGVLQALGAFTSLGIDDNATSNAITIEADEDVILVQNLALVTTKEFLFDGGGGHTKIAETASDVLSITVGGVLAMTITEATTISGSLIGAWDVTGAHTAGTIQSDATVIALTTMTTGANAGTSGQVNFIASDNDQGDTGISTDDRFVISNFSGGMDLADGILQIGGSQIDSDDMADVSSMGMLDENETMLQEWYQTVSAGLTAVNPGNQGDGPLTSQINEISIVVNDADARTLPTAVAGLHVYIINNDASESLEIWPASSDNAGAGVDTAINLAAGANLHLTAIDNTNWETF